MCARPGPAARPDPATTRPRPQRAPPRGCLLYTSDAADERSSVDLGGRRIIKKKNTHYKTGTRAILAHTIIRTEQTTKLDNAQEQQWS